MKNIKISHLMGRLSKALNVSAVEHERIEKMTKQEEMLNAILDLTNKYNDLNNNFKNLRDSMLLLYGEKGLCRKSSPPRLQNILSIQECYREFETKAPVAFNAYLQCLKNGEKSYEGCPTDSCSVRGHISAARFKLFLQRYFSLYEVAYVLDIGCGPQPVPIYLEDYPVELIYGLDPLLPITNHPFHFCQGLCEHIPWNDDSMDIVIFGTSFDHLFLIDEALNECARVLKVGGYVIVWAGVFSNVKEYNPYERNFEPFDQYHMFACSLDNLNKYFSCAQYENKKFELHETFRNNSQEYFISFQLKKKIL